MKYLKKNYSVNNNVYLFIPQSVRKKQKIQNILSLINKLVTKKNKTNKG